MYSSLQNGSISPASMAGGGIATVVALPVTGVGPMATLSVKGNSLIISILLALSVICLVAGIRVLHRAGLVAN